MRDPIGVLDSGVGGLSVLREIRRALPREDLVYVADSAYAPYGDQSEALITERAAAIVEFLIGQRAKAIVVACNTATGVAVDALRARFSLPIVAMEPAVKPAATMTRSGRIGVLATSRTLASDKFARLLATHAAGIDVIIQPCPGLVEQVERGDFSSAATHSLVERYVRPLVEKGVDAIVLGCTHYPFLDRTIRGVAGDQVAIVDPADAVARELRRRLEVGQLLSADPHAGSERFFTSGSPEAVRPVLAQLWAGDPQVERIPS